MSLIKVSGGQAQDLFKGRQLNRSVPFIPLTPDQMQEELEDLDSGAGISKVLGRPAWLQDPLYESPRYYFLAQLTETDITKISPGHEGLFGGGIGYIFADNRAKKMKEGDLGGYFLTQFT